MMRKYSMWIFNGKKGKEQTQEQDVCSSGEETQDLDSNRQENFRFLGCVFSVSGISFLFWSLNL